MQFNSKDLVPPFGCIWRAFRVNHSNKTITVLYEGNSKDAADEAVHLDCVDERSPDKNDFFSWHTKAIDRSLAKKG